MRSRPGKHLTREGVALARDVGAHIGAVDLVVTSDLPRAIETAIAMGYASDRQIKDLFGADIEVEWSAGFAAIGAAARTNKRVGRAARELATIMSEIARSLPDEGRALVISHGGVIEMGVVGLLPDLDLTHWGPSCDYCEGVRLYFEGDACTGVDLMRLSDLMSQS